MATTQAPTTAREHLERLAAILRQRQWKAQLRGGETHPTLRVTNPAAPVLCETIHCLGESYLWSWRERIGAVDVAEAVADRITHVLRSKSP